MRFNVTTILKDLKGEEIEFEEKPLDIQTAFYVALNNSSPTEILTQEQKIKGFSISKKLFANKEVDLTVNELAYVKERSYVVWNTLISGVINDLIEQISSKQSTN